MVNTLAGASSYPGHCCQCCSGKSCQLKERQCILILMKLVKLSSHEAFKFNPKEFTSCMPKGLAFKDSIAGRVEPVHDSPWPSDRTGSEITGPELQGCSRESAFTWRTHLNVHLFSLLWPLPAYLQRGWAHEEVGKAQALLPCPSLSHGITKIADLKPILALALLNTSVSMSF